MTSSLSVPHTRVASRDNLYTGFSCLERLEWWVLDRFHILIFWAGATFTLEAVLAIFSVGISAEYSEMAELVRMDLELGIL
jgi:hypothetical protein